MVQTRGYHLVALTPDTAARDLERYVRPQNTRAVALLLGNEGDGLSPQAMRAVDVRLRIPVCPPVDSLTVATAATIALHHISVCRR